MRTLQDLSTSCGVHKTFDTNRQSTDCQARRLVVRTDLSVLCWLRGRFHCEHHDETRILEPVVNNSTALFAYVLPLKVKVVVQ
jgi:hypothetical protein